MAITSPLPRAGSWRRRFAPLLVRARSFARGRRVAAPPALRNLAQIPLTFAACVAVTIGSFQIFHHGGWYVLAASLVYLEHLIADES